VEAGGCAGPVSSRASTWLIADEALLTALSAALSAPLAASLTAPGALDRAPNRPLLLLSPPLPLALVPVLLGAADACPNRGEAPSAQHSHGDPDMRC
jgi:hypothetical protein